MLHFVLSPGDDGWAPSGKLTSHSPSMFAVKVKIYGVLYNRSSSFTFDKTSSYWSAPKTSLFLCFSLVTTW